MRKVRLGIIGTGIAARDLYWPVLKELRSRIEIVGVANRRLSKAEAFAKVTGVPKVFSDGEALLRDPSIEGVILSLPIPVIASWVLRSLKAGKYVLSEKPIASSVAEGRRLLKAAAPFKNRWMVGENYFFTPHIIQAKSWIRSGRIGQIRFVEASQLNLLSRDGKYYKTTWRQKPEFVGGFVVDAGVHIAHMARDLFGMPEILGRRVARFNPLARPIDTAIATLRFKNGALGIWKSCFGVKPSSEIPMLQVYGSKGSVQIFHDYSLLHDLKGAKARVDSKRSGFYDQFLKFGKMLQKGKVAYAPEDALKDLAFIEGIAR